MDDKASLRDLAGTILARLVAANDQLSEALCHARGSDPISDDPKDRDESLLGKLARASELALELTRRSSDLAELIGVEKSPAAGAAQLPDPWPAQAAEPNVVPRRGGSPKGAPWSPARRQAENERLARLAQQKEAARGR